MFKFFGVIVSLLFLTLSGAIAQEEPVRSIVNVTGDLYRFQNNNHYGVFLVTSKGIILADPLNKDTAEWLKGELKERFDKEVKVVIYSHHHADHTSGGEVFEDTATYFANVRAKAKIEASGHTTPPNETFDGAITLQLGGKTVELYYFWPSHTDNLISILFPQERALFQVDSVAIKRLPYRDLRDFSVYGTVRSLREIQQLDFDILVPGHGEIGTKEDITDYISYLDDLNAGVVEVLKRGGSVEEAKQTILLEKYKEWAQYDEWRALNVEGAYNNFIEFGFIPIEKKDPTYPRRAAQKGICGWVVVEYDITAEGTTENVRVVESEPRTVFDWVARKAAKKYKYFNINPVKGVKTRITFEMPSLCRVISEELLEEILKN